ncbi:MAG: RNA pyrophosphohydrolase [Algiphilus sp.]
MIDADGYRLNVGIVVANARRELLMGKRVRRNAWQFPQGGIDPGEGPQDALWRELYEELGFERDQLEVIGCTRGWLHYRLPQRFLRAGTPQCIGQKQKWFLLRLLDPNAMPRFDRGPRPEFDAFRWVGLTQAVRDVVGFKREVYRCALNEFAPMLGIDERPPRRLSGGRGRRARKMAG